MNFPLKIPKEPSTPLPGENHPRCDICFQRDCLHAEARRLFSCRHVSAAVERKLGRAASGYFIKSVFDWSNER